jgi:hypothetical protein
VWAAWNQALLPDELLVLTTAPSSAQSSLRPKSDMAVLSIVFYNEGQIPVDSKLPLDPTKVQWKRSHFVFAFFDVPDVVTPEVCMHVSVIGQHVRPPRRSFVRDFVLIFVCHWRQEV